MVPARPSRRLLLGQVGAGCGGLLLLGATALPWSRRGAGSRIALADVADLLLSGRLEAWAPRAAGLLVYAVPLGGALLLVGGGLGGRIGRVVAATAVVLAAAGLLLARAALAQVGATGWGPGVIIAVAGVTVGGAATVVLPSRPAEPREPSATEGEGTPPRDAGMS